MFLKNIRINCSLKKKNLCQLCIDCESNIYIWKIFWKKIKVLFIPVAIEGLSYLTPSETKVKFLYLLKHLLAKKVNAKLYSNFLFGSIKITQFLSPWLKNELITYLLLDSKMRKLHTLALDFVGWPFGISITRHFRPKPSHSNDRIYRKPKQKIENVTQWRVRQLSTTTPELWKFFQNQFCCF